MINQKFRKKIVDSWFSYLQIQVCRSFERLENNKFKFTRRDWRKEKNNEGQSNRNLRVDDKFYI